MKQTIWDIAREVKQGIEQQIPLVDMRVFGSYARDEQEDGSDIDLFVEIEELTRSAKLYIREIAWTVGLKHSAVISPLVFSRDEIEQSPVRSSPVVLNILREGIRI